MWIPWISYNVTDVPSKADWFSLVLFYCYWLLVLLSTTKGIFLFLKQKLKLLMLLLKERSSIESFKGMASFILALSPQILTTVSVVRSFNGFWSCLNISSYSMDLHIISPCFNKTTWFAFGDHGHSFIYTNAPSFDLFTLPSIAKCLSSCIFSTHRPWQPLNNFCCK